MAAEDENKGPTVAELQAQIEALSGEKASMLSKMDELLTETKANKAKARDAEQAAVDATAEKARKSGDFESLLASSETERKRLLDENAAIKGGIATDKRDNQALKMAGELAEGENIGLLAEFIGRRLKYTDEGLKVLDKVGNPTISEVSALKDEFKNDARYASLLKGNQSSGGGATGGSGSGGAVQEMPRSDFEALDPIARAKFMQSGGYLTH